MKLISSQNYLPVLIVSLVLLWGCKQPETVVIEDAPTASAPADTTEEYPTGDDNSDFRKLVIGEYQSITSFDPLLADNGATMRALQLIYEGLVRLDSNGNTVPAVAKNWEVSNDSLTYTFTLNQNIYYHDSEVFSTGTGRRLTAQDVKFVFERMAKAGNPSTAAKLFWNIKGFEPYYQEQHNVYEPEKRTLSEVSGIQTPNDSTVVFELHEEDPQFLEKLATPYALIYPREAVNNTQKSFAPVGSGPFTLSSQRADSGYIFAKSQKYHAYKTIRLNRVDILTSSSESNLIRQMASGNIHLLPEIGPNIIQNFATDAGTLKAGFNDRYTLTKRNNPIEITLRFNPNTDITEEDAERISRLTYANTSSYFEQLPDPIVAVDSTENQQPSDTTITEENLYAVFSDDPFIRTYLGNLSKILNRQGVNLEMTKFRIPTRNTELWVTQHASFINEDKDKLNNNYPVVFRFRVYPTALQRNEITGLNFNQYGWWLNLRGVSLPTADKLN
ncbi:ABC transporter substrate-binding protein [Fodinibius sp.]|uniref:ABC transporter substrate-binding protein n=1 Tax=Fodinibius sp. TaxID=1872440 RepID=UPI002ACD50FE|nr:ABC transporter substrate-binding protein [Fodinibius sp.]MDZ7658183.1 ABC transporter substrate-binding protein [Fodinibius sp.]